MSWQSIVPRKVQLGGPSVFRLLPNLHKRMVGPFIFLDHFPRAEISAEVGFNVRPHPHIGLSTLSYLLEGSVLHHDSLGYQQVLTPGDVNWMTAGRGIAHSEKVPDHLRGTSYHLHLMQFWVALPLEHEDIEPSFTHHGRDSIPQRFWPGGSVRIVVGQDRGQRSPVKAYSPMIFKDIELDRGQSYEYDPGTFEVGACVLEGQIKCVADNELILNPEMLAVAPRGLPLRFTALENSRFVIFGGEPFPEERHIEWNFVSSSTEKINAAVQSWRDGSFPQVPGEPDIIPY